MSYLSNLFFIFIMINDMNTDILVLLLIFNMSYFFWMIAWMKNMNDFQMAKVPPHSVV